MPFDPNVVREYEITFHQIVTKTVVRVWDAGLSFENAEAMAFRILTDAKPEEVLANTVPLPAGTYTTARVRFVGTRNA